MTGDAGAESGVANAKATPPAIMRPNPSIAMRTGWTIPVTAAATVPNMNTKKPAKTTAMPAAVRTFVRRADAAYHCGTD